MLFTEHRAAIDYLSDEDAGKLIKALFAYVDEGQLTDFNGPMMSLFTVIRTQIDRSHEAYKAKCERNSANAKKRFATHSASATVSSGNPSQANVSERMPPHTDASLPNPNQNPIPNPGIDDGADRHIINDTEVVEDEEYSFDKIWDLYDKHVGNIESLRNTWTTLFADQKRKIFDYVTINVRVRPDRKYRKNFENFLACRTRETEPINQTDRNGSNNQYGNQSNESRRETVCRNATRLITKLIGESNATSVGETTEETPTISEFLVAYSPNRQTEICHTPEACYVGDSPTLAMLNTCSGRRAAEAWLVPEIIDACLFCGLKEQPDTYQLEKLVQIIVVNFGYLSVDELQLFFFYFCSAHYRHFYNTFDPSIIILSLRDFLRDRNRAYEEREQRERE